MLRSIMALAAIATMATTARAADAPAKRIRPSKIILIGDSTVQQHSGWGGSFCALRVISLAACVNLGRGGRSTKSYRAEGSWDVALNEMRVKGYDNVWVLIQFGHNDRPGKPGRSTDLETEFPANLRRYVAEARAAGAKPILVTPLTQRMFGDGKLIADLDPWAAAIRKVAAETHAPLVDLNARSAAIIRVMGPAMSTHYAKAAPSADIIEAALTGTTIDTNTTPPPTAIDHPTDTPLGTRLMNPVFDYTHLNRDGADLFAAVVADELAEQVPEMRPVLVP